MKVLLTGASGLIGREVGRVAAENGHEVYALARDAERARRDLDFAAGAVGWDDLNRNERILGACDAVVHLAGESVAEGRWTDARKAQILASRVNTTQTLAKMFRKISGDQGSAHPRVWVNGSAIGLFGDRGEEELVESSQPGHGFLADVVRAWEAELRDDIPSGVRCVWARFGMVLSGRGGALPLMAKPFKLGLGGRVGSGKQWMSWIHVDDVVRVLLAALNDDRYAGPIHVVAPEPIRNEDFTRALASVCGRPAVIPVPAIALRIALGGKAALALDSLRVLPGRLRELGFEYKYPGLEEALRAAL